ncbi:MAG: phosphotransferase, partial [Verrucomicrobia bacterium]|nr:phosphotransferase [Verrucomicrobiota bacterium]
EILPRLPLPALRCFGVVEDESPEFCWLFLEDAGQELFSFSSLAHAAAAARWMAILHTATARFEANRRLPARGPDYYWSQLELARNNLRGGLGNRALQAEGAAVVEAILTQCDWLESRWETVAAFCRDVPETLVHGDLKENNLRVRDRCGQIDVRVFDWEIAGWGTPATDLLKCPDFARYWLEARAHWPALDSANLQRLAQVGMLFRSLLAISWESLDLGGDWVQWPVGKLRHYSVRLIEACRTLGLT